MMAQMWSSSLKKDCFALYEMNETSSAVGAQMFNAISNNYNGYYNGTIEKGFAGKLQTCVKNNSTGVNGNFISILNNSIFSIGASGIDSPFSASVLIKYISNATGNGWLIAKRGGLLVEYQFIIFGGVLYFEIRNPATNSNYINATFAIASLSLQNAVWYRFTFTYDGSKSQNGIKIYFNNVLLSTTNSMTGTYTGSNNNSLMDIGIANFIDQIKPNAYIDQTAFWRKELTQQDINELHNGNNGKQYQ